MLFGNPGDGMCNQWPINSSNLISSPFFGFWGNSAPAWRVRSVGFDSSNMAQKRSFCTACMDIGGEELRSTPFGRFGDDAAQTKISRTPKKVLSRA